ncbi:MAG TPA: hypothetical protein VIN05_11415 [Roseovarius sp.]
MEEILRSAILRRLADNKSSDELFGEQSFAGLVILGKYAHALGMIGENELSALRKFSKARNKLAHSWKADFTDPELQKIAGSIQFLRIKGESDMSDHQLCFSRLDYLGVYLTQEFLNRFNNITPMSYDSGIFLTGLVIDPETGLREKKVARGP